MGGFTSRWRGTTSASPATTARTSTLAGLDARWATRPRPGATRWRTQSSSSASPSSLDEALPRSHPPTLITLVRASVREHALIARGSTVLVAVSGGPDSMALLHVLGLLRRDLAFGLFAHGVDHGLRAEAAAE